MGDRRPKKRIRRQANKPPAGPNPFAECGLSAADFEVECGGGKSFLPGGRLVWMTVRHKATGRTVKGKIGTEKRHAAEQQDKLLRHLLQSFRKTPPHG